MQFVKCINNIVFKGVCSIIQDCIVAFLLHCLKTEYLMKIIYFMLFGFLFFTVTKAGSGNLTCEKMLTIDNAGSCNNFNYCEKVNNPCTYLFNGTCHLTGYTAASLYRCQQKSKTNNNGIENNCALKRVIYISSRISGALILPQRNGQVAVLVNPLKNSLAQFRVGDLRGKANLIVPVQVSNEITLQNGNLNSGVCSKTLNNLAAERITRHNGILC